MVKRIFTASMILLVGAISVLSQIDYNKQIKNLPSISQGNMNGVRVVDGLKFAQSAAGINAADADLGTAFGEIWIPSTALAGMTATDAQISISKNHTLRLMGRLTIDSVNKGPILLATGSKIICNDTDTSSIINVGVGTSPSVIRLAVQDGSVTDGLFVEGCLISAGVQPVTNGVIDASGSVNLAYIRNNYIFGFTSGWGIFVQDIQSGALAGTNNLAIQGNNITATGTGGCIEIFHSATNAVLLANFSIIDNSCATGGSDTSPSVLLQNTAASTKLQIVNILNLNLTAVPASQLGVSINGVFFATLKHIECTGGLNCVNIANNTNNLAVSVDNVGCGSCNNVLNDVANAYTNSNNYINHYGFTATSAGFTGNNVLAGVTQTGNFNQIRIIDGVRFAKSAAGINAADADCVAGSHCEIWIPPTGITATDAQISITAGHVLRVMGLFSIDTVNKGPILMGSGTKITCSDPSPDNNAQILNVGVGASVSMVRATVQDGSQTNMTIEGCYWYGGVQPFNVGIIDATGFGARGLIANNKLAGFNSNWGIFIQDNQTGALAGTNNLEIINNTIVTSSTGMCIELLHSSTNAVAIAQIDIIDTSCTVTASMVGSAVLLTNPVASASTNLRQIFITNLTMANVPASQNGLTIGGASMFSAKNIACTGGGNLTCVNIPSNANNIDLIFDQLHCFGCLSLLTDTANGFSTSNNVISRYDFPTSNSTQVGEYLNVVSFLKVQGGAPASATGTGFGTGPTFAFDPGSTNNAGVISITSGTTPAASGTVTLNFNTTQSNFGVNNPSCQWSPADSTGFWNTRVTIHTGGTISPTTINALWDNNAVNLAASVIFKIAYWCAAK